ncbi:hypothetical protein DFP72DRAFT_897971 [Ephemerocybe angulata]|uniref:F-box domain-containing protein n=1 Tax=Ephemerocybe angulata TaxID=980116 RepID=A0A8H6HXD7_9AGAR|nr:hypothetical protein DFP72DRAFT_897971 [Tulosesus angulatus]
MTIEANKPDLPGIFYTNDVPTTHEVMAARQGIPPLASKVAELRSQLQVLEDQLFRHHSVLSTSRYMPPEILGDIFHLAMGTDVLTKEGRQALIDITRVCKKWREAAYLTGQLWARLHIPSPRFAPFDDIEKWLSRSKGSPKTIVFGQLSDDDEVWGLNPIYCDCLAPSECTMNTPRFLKFLTNGPHLHELALRNISANCLRAMLESTKRLTNASDSPTWHAWDSLTVTFEGDVEDNSWGMVPLPTLSPFFHLPAVRSLTISLPEQETEEGITSAHLYIPSSVLQGLTFLDIECNWDSPQLLFSLKHCVNLQRLSLNFSDAVQTWTSNDPALSDIGTISLSTVHSLTVKHCPRATASLFFRHLHFPSLVDLRLTQTYYHDDDLDEEEEEDEEDPRPLYNMLEALGIFSHSASTLQSLSIIQDDDSEEDTEEVPPEDLVDTLRSLPNLTHLAMDVNFDARSFLSVAQGSKSGVLAPNLEHIELTRVVDEFDFESLFRYLLHRKTTGVGDKMKKITMSVDFRGEHPETDMVINWGIGGILRELRKTHGIVIEFRPIDM